MLRYASYFFMKPYDEFWKFEKNTLSKELLYQKLLRGIADLNKESMSRVQRIYLLDKLCNELSQKTSSLQEKRIMQELRTQLCSLQCFYSRCPETLYDNTLLKIQALEYVHKKLLNLLSQFEDNSKEAMELDSGTAFELSLHPAAMADHLHSLAHCFTNIDYLTPDGDIDKGSETNLVVEFYIRYLMEYLMKLVSEAKFTSPGDEEKLQIQIIFLQMISGFELVTSKDPLLKMMLDKIRKEGLTETVAQNIRNQIINEMRASNLPLMHSKIR